MRFYLTLILLPVLILSLVACSPAVPANEGAAGLANPWTDSDTLAAAEEAVGFSLGLPEVIADSYQAVSFRSMNGELLEVLYRDQNDPDYTVCVRKQKGEDADISGNYNEYSSVTTEEVDGVTVTYKSDASNELQMLLSCGGYSYSLYAEHGCWGDSAMDFISAVVSLK